MVTAKGGLKTPRKTKISTKNPWKTPFTKKYTYFSQKNIDHWQNNFQFCVSLVGIRANYKNKTINSIMTGSQIVGFDGSGEMIN